MYRQIEAFVASAAEAFGLSGPVYQFGQWPYEGGQLEAMLRGCFSRTGFVGCELSAGVKVRKLPFPDGAAQTVICAATVDRAFPSGRAAAELQRILAPGGALLVHVPPEVSAESGRWLATPSSVERLLTGMSATVVGWQGPDTSAGAARAVFGVGFKAPLGSAVLEGTRRFLDGFPVRLAAARRVGWRKRLRRLLATLARGRLGDFGTSDGCELQFAVHLTVDRSFEPGSLSGILSPQQIGTRVDLLD